MVLHEDAAGRAAVEVLIESGRLASDFWLRSELLRDLEHAERARQVSDAVKFALGVDGVRLPDWADPLNKSPDCVWIYPGFRKQYRVTEPYYTPNNLRETFLSCHGDVDLETRDGTKIERRFGLLALRSWSRILPYFDAKLGEDILQIEMEKGNNGHDFSKSARKNSVITGANIRDGALYDFYQSKGGEELEQIFHGIGKKAVLGVGAMLFLSGDHDDMMPFAEQLSDVLKMPNNKK